MTMDYKGSYEVFDLSKVKTYPLKVRPNKVELDDFLDVSALRKSEIKTPKGPWFRNGQPGTGDTLVGLKELASYIVTCRRAGLPVIVFSGAHPIKNGQISIVIDLIERGLVTLYSTNGAGTIHSFELALTGASSESVRDALPKGEFGMAFETGAYLNYAIEIGVERGYGFGESMGRLYCDAAFRKAVIDRTFEHNKDTGEYFKPYDGFRYADSCVFAAAYRKGIPVCVHAAVGTDIIDQHTSFSGATKGLASGRDFLVFCKELCRFTRGGVILNIGTAIMGPEVVLKAASLATTVGWKPNGLSTANVDVRPFTFNDAVRDASKS